MARTAKRLKTIHLMLDVTVPEDTETVNVIESINAALDEPPCDWGPWIVGAVEEDLEY